MAKKNQETQDIAEDLGGLPPELQVNDVVDPSVIKEENTLTAETTESDPPLDNIEHNDEIDTFVVVVKKGHSVQHNGVLYRENQKITLEDEDAARLLSLGVVVTLVELAAKLAKSNPSGTVTINGR